MASSSVVVLLVALGGAREPSTRAMASATQDALDPSAVVLVREVEEATLASDDRAAALADAVHADAIAVLTWPDADHRRAHVHVLARQASGAPRWIDRDIAFRDVDAADERGKALGFAVASMVPLRRPEASRDLPVVVAPTVRPPEREATPPPPPEPPRAAPRGAVDLLVVASVGVGGDAGGFGSEAGARFFLGPRFAARVGGGLRIGDVPEARASSYVGRVEAGLAWRALATRGERPFAIGPRADVVLLYQELARPTSNDATSRGARWTPGGDVMLEATWTFVPGAALVVAGGAEVASSPTRVVVDDATTAEIPRLRILGQSGIWVFF
jgi:hypothetical protein